MALAINTVERKPIWIALSHLYLDTELQDYDFKYIAKIFLESPYSLDEIKAINKREVFPILHKNVLGVAGEWTGFNEEWLINEITHSLQNKNIFKKLADDLAYRTFNRMDKDWKTLEKYILI
jgi:hypothetical protein